MGTAWVREQDPASLLPARLGKPLLPETDVKVDLELGRAVRTSKSSTQEAEANRLLESQHQSRLESIGHRNQNKVTDLGWLIRYHHTVAESLLVIQIFGIQIPFHPDKMLGRSQA